MFSSNRKKNDTTSLCKTIDEYMPDWCIQNTNKGGLTRISSMNKNTKPIIKEFNYICCERIQNVLILEIQMVKFNTSPVYYFGFNTATDFMIRLG